MGGGQEDRALRSDPAGILAGNRAWNLPLAALGLGGSHSLVRGANLTLARECDLGSTVGEERLGSRASPGTIPSPNGTMDDSTDQTAPSARARANEVHVRCENCGAAVYWKPSAQGLACEHCGAVRSVERLPGHILERPLTQTSQSEAEAQHPDAGLATKALRCDNCGARVVLVEREISQACSFCGSSHVLPDEERRAAIRPESLIPLMLPREQVAQAFSAWLASLWFRPNALKRLDVYDAVGLYVPAWTFDARADSSWTAQAGYYYYVTESYTTVVNGRSVLRTRQVRKVRWEPASGRRRDVFDDLQVLASKGIDPQLALELGRFDTQALVPYRPEYLIGWEAEEYVIDLEAGWRLGEERMRSMQEDRCSSDVPGDTQRDLRVSTRLDDVRWKHVLLPLWSLTYRFQGKPYAVLIHGQSGAIVGRAPYSWTKIFALVFLLLVLGLALFLATQTGGGGRGIGQIRFG